MSPDQIVSLVMNIVNQGVSLFQSVATSVMGILNQILPIIQAALPAATAVAVTAASVGGGASPTSQPGSTVQAPVAAATPGLPGAVNASLMPDTPATRDADTNGPAPQPSLGGGFASSQSPQPFSIGDAGAPRLEDRQIPQPFSIGDAGAPRLEDRQDPQPLAIGDAGAPRLEDGSSSVGPGWFAGVALTPIAVGEAATDTGSRNPMDNIMGPATP